MSYEATLDMARQGRLYPAVILYGSSFEARRDATLELSRTLLCTAEDAAARPCGACRPCQRIVWPDPAEDHFHPDFHVLERDLRTNTSIDATKRFLSSAGNSPFESRGQIFVFAEADTLSPGAGDALLKMLEEPPGSTPRHFFLLAGSRLDLLPTLRSRSLSIYLGEAEALDEEVIAAVTGELENAAAAYLETASPIYLLAVAGALGEIPGFDDPRARRPWAMAAASVLRLAQAWNARPVAVRRALLALAAALHDAPVLRLRYISPSRILEGLVARHLAGMARAR